jgi:amino acid adenylation domain-containing protein
MNQDASSTPESIAVIGMSGRFPGAANVDEFWRVLTGGIDAIERFDPSTLEYTCASPEDVSAGRRFVSARGVLADADKFDAAFFGIYPKEAELMDPQHRFFLECAWESLESAGYDPARFPGLIGVYAGVSLNTYLLWNLGRGRLLAGNYQVGEYQTMLGNDKDFMPVRVSYKLNLRGPSMGVQCACSTSLVAICQAATSLLTYQCDMALAGGSSISFPQRRDYPFEPDAMVSADGACRAFDAGANGTIFGHGCGVVLLKRLGEALADGDPVLAVIRGWAVNNDGSDKIGFAAPSVKAQADVIAMAQAAAGVHPRDVSYIEAHGTGTPLGDPIEVAALTEAFRAGGATGNGYCALGTGKTHIGHLDVAAGAAGLIKTLLQFRHERIPALRTYTAPNPRIDFAHSPFVPVAQPLPWPRGPKPRLAGVSAFGVGGTNAHVVVEEPPLRPASGPGHAREVLVLSARTPSALESMTARLAAHLEAHPDLPLADVAYTLATGRRRFAFRRALAARDTADAVARLKASAGTPVSERPGAAVERPVVFLFPGQGAQFVGMGQSLYEREAAFRSAVDECAEGLRAHLGVDLRDTLFPAAADRAAAEQRIHETWLTQPAIFTIELAMARLWMSWGVKPAMVMGHSVGEYVAAVLAGTFTLADALRLLARRARLMMDLPAGSMLAVRMSADEIAPLLPPGVSVAAVNSPKLCTVSGPTEAIRALQAALEAKGGMARLLPTSHAFHSSMMDPILETFAREASAIPHRAPALPWISTCTGRAMLADDVADAGYWARQLRQPVLFGQALEKAFAVPGAILLEVGPGQALAQFARQHPARPAAVDVVASLPGQEGSERALDDAAQALAQLWCAGWEPDWAAWYGGSTRYRLTLPTYPFERQRFWIEASPDAVTAPALDDRAGPETAERVTAAEPATAQDAVLQDVLAILQDLSGLEASALAPEKPFLEMGFDSLFLTQVSLAFQKKFLVKVTLRQMLDDLSSPAAIARHIAAHRPAPAATPAAAVPAADKLAMAQSGPFGPEATPAAPAAPAVTRHGPFAPINKAAGDALTPKQQQHLDALIAHYTAMTRRSKEHTQKHRTHFSDPRAVSGFRVMWKEMTYPVVSARSAGSKIWDLDGNEFLDVTMGFGTYLFGHNPEFIRKAIEKQLQTGIEIGPQNAVAGEVARIICGLSGMERVTFCTTGSEAVMGAVRAARTVTGRHKVVYFSGDYHGIHEEVLAKGQWVQGRSRTVPIAPGIPMELVSQVHVLTYGDPASLEWIRAHGDDLAAVLVEPVQSRKPELQPKEFLLALRELTREKGIALIFDEIVTGFRIHQRGAQAWYGVQADLATYGKIIGGGLPIGVIAGRHAYLDAFDGGMWQYGDSSVPEAGVTFFAGTFVRHPLAMAAAKAVLDYLGERGPALQEELNARTAVLTGRLNALFEATGVDLKVHHCGSLWHFSHGESFKFYSLMFHFLRDQGIHIWEGRPCFMSTAHTEDDLERLLSAFQKVMKAMREGGFLPAPVVAIPDSGPFPLTDAQQEIWLTSRMDASALPAYNESCAFTFRGRFNRSALEQALDRLVQRHEALRTTIEPSGELQRVHPFAPPTLAWSDLSQSAEPGRAERLAALVQDEVRLPFDLTQPPLLRARVVRLGEDHHVMLLTVHHVVCDGWSYDVMARDLSTLYSQACRGERDERPLPGQFRAYARLLAGYRAEPRYEADLAYWTRSLAAPPEPVQLPVDRTRPALRTFAGAMEVAPVEGALLDAIKELGAQKRCTLFSTLLALYAVLMNRLTGQREFVIGIPAAGQQMMENQDLVGHCANLLPLRLRVDPEQPFGELLASAQRALLDAYEHQGITFGALLQALQLPRDPSRPPLIQVTFNVDPAMHGLRFEGLETEIVINPRAAYQFEHSLNIVAYSSHLRLECNYNTDLFEAATIRRWLGHFREIARAVAREPGLAIGAIPMLTDGEQLAQVQEWNRTESPYPAACIHELFEEVVRKDPSRVAVSWSGRTLTYGELNRQANQLARHLVAAGVGPDQAVGLCAERSPEMVMGLLGILKAGGAYLPLDPAHPQDRHRLQLTDAQATVVVGQGRLASLVRNQGVTFVPLDDPQAAWRQQDGADLSPAERGGAHRPGQLAYILYTSGSTGQPKGVMIEHRSVVRLVRGVRYVRLGADERMACLSPLAFDASTFELWGSLLHGARLALMPPGPFSMTALVRLLDEEKVTLMFLTTSLFHALVDDHVEALAPVRQLLTGGEVTSGERIARALQRHRQLEVIHCYGPTESTTFALTETFRAGDQVEDPPPLGRPISNTQAYVLDEQLRPVPVGVTGELCLGGDGLARGYLNRPELTEQAFVPNALPGTPGGKLYRTGDLASRRPDGRIDFHGRRDNQVKVRGFRIEPGEIESVLATYPGVAASAVVLRADGHGDKQLVAHVAVAEGRTAPTTEALRAHLRTSLPEFMIPALFTLSGGLPLTSSGKVDRQALQEIETTAAPSGTRFEAPRTELETRVAEIWSQLLGLPRVGRQDDFFASGGHSLLALKLITRLRDAGFTIEVADLFRHPTVAQLADVLAPLATKAVPLQSEEFVVRLKDGRPGRPPLCLLPSDFGDLLIYANLLPLLDAEQPCIGLQCPRMYEDDQGIASMPDLARFFMKQLLTVQPVGPFLLAGYCFGGHVALELAKQLTAAGHQVAMLTLIDARPYRPVVERTEYLRMLLTGALRARPADWKRSLAARWKMHREGALIDRLARTSPERLDRRDLNRWVLEQRTLQSYRSVDYHGRITYFYPDESQYLLYGDPSCGWLYMAERVVLHKVTGSHLNMMKEPHVRLLAEQLQAGLRRAVAGAGGGG